MGKEWLKTLMTELNNAFDKQQAYENTRIIYENDRLFDCKHFNKTADNAIKMMEAAGLTDIEKLPLKADGHTLYGLWELPRAWDINSATLRIVSPDTKEDDILCDYAAVPCSVMMYSGVTPKEGITAEVIDIDALTGGYNLQIAFSTGALAGQSITGLIKF